MNKDIRNLIFQAIDETISSEDFDRLQSEIEHDEVVRNEYLRALNLCETLSEISEEAPALLTVASQAAHSEFGWGTQLFRYCSVAAAAMVLTACSLIYPFLWNIDSDQRARQTEQPSVNWNVNEKTIARIIQRIDCVMQHDKWNVANTTDLESGQFVRLSQGLATIEFVSGARVTLEGPAELEIVTKNRGFLHSGKLTAVVPESAVGFEVLTPTSRLIDHGTEFGVSVDETGASETHVFDGEVELIAPERENRLLTKSMSARVSGKRVRLGDQVLLNALNFIRIPELVLQRPSSSDVVTDLPDREHLISWFEASQGVQLDSDSRIISWQNLAGNAANTDQSNPSVQAPSTAWQVNANRRPHWEQGGFGKSENSMGKPAIRFGGRQTKEFLVTTPIKTGEDVTSFVVCSCVPRSGYAPLLSLEGPIRVLMARNKATSISFNENDAPAFRKETLKSTSQIFDAPMLCAIRYSYESKTFQWFVNGELQSEGKPLGMVSTNLPQVIGSDKDGSKFFLNGSIAEIVVYDQMLERESFDQANKVLMEKYGIATFQE